MPKALFFNVPGHGHVTPSLPLVAELVRRGHEIIYFVTERYRASVEATGAVFRPYSSIGDDYFDGRGLSGSVPQKVARALMTTSEEILPELLEMARAEKPDYILYDGMCPWGFLVARILKAPSVASLALSPLISPPPSAGLKMLPVLLPLVFRDFGEGLKANQQANALTKRYGIPPLGMTGIMNNPGDISLSYTSAYYQPFADTVQDHVRFVGWTLNEPRTKDSFPRERLQGRRVIYVSLGTLNNEDAGFFRMCIEAFAGRDELVVMTTGNRIAPESFGVLPENIAIYKWVPQTEILKHAALFISHGGLNSIHDSLYLGVPMLLIPQQAEQMMNAMRVVELNAGLILKKGQVNVQNLHEGAVRVMTEPYFREQAARIGETFRAAGGVSRAADEIEGLLAKTRQGVTRTG